MNILHPTRVPHNKQNIDEERLVRMYNEDRTAIRKMAAEYGVTIQALYYRLERLGIKRRSGGDANRGTQARENNPNWKGGRWSKREGYIVINTPNGEIYEHRLIAENVLGRQLHNGEVVHHKNGIRSDNSPENIEVFSSHSEHRRS